MVECIYIICDVTLIVAVIKYIIVAMIICIFLLSILLIKVTVIDTVSVENRQFCLFVCLYCAI